MYIPVAAYFVLVGLVMCTLKKSHHETLLGLSQRSRLYNPTDDIQIPPIPDLKSVIRPRYLGYHHFLGRKPLY